MNVGWILCGPRTVPSARIEGYRLHEWLTQNGHNSHLLYTPSKFTHSLNILPGLPNVDVVIFQKVFTEMATYALNLYRQKSIKSVYYVTDLLLGFEYMFESVDRIILSTMLLKKLAGPRYESKIRILKDSYETPRELYKTDYKTDKLRVTWFGMPYNFERSESFRPMIESLGCIYTTITDHPKATKQWSEDTIAQDLLDSDVIIIPPDLALHSNLYKDENKLVQSMVLGLPCIVSAVPAYVELWKLKYKDVEPFIIVEDNTWEEKIKFLMDENNRRTMGEYARKCVVDEYHIDTIGKKFVEIVEGI